MGERNLGDTLDKVAISSYIEFMQSKTFERKSCTAVSSLRALFFNRAMFISGEIKVCQTPNEHAVNL